MHEHPDNPERRTTVLLHKGSDLPHGLVREIFEDAGLTVDELIDLF